MSARNTVLLAALASAPVAWGLIHLGSAAGASPVAARVLAAVSSPVAILQDRSPGARRDGVVQTKVAAGQHPTERVLAQVRRRPAAVPVPPSAPPTLSPAALESMPVLAPVGFLASSPLETLAPAPVAVGGGSPGPGALLMPVPAAGGTPGEGTPGTPGTPTPPPAVPEPGTWASLLTGLAILSASLRHARRRQAQAAPSAAG